MHKVSYVNSILYLIRLSLVRLGFASLRLVKLCIVRLGLPSFLSLAV